MQVEGGRDHRGERDGGSHPSGSFDPAEVQCVERDGIPAGEERTDDLRSACEPEIQVRQPSLLVAGVVREYGWTE